MRLQQEIYKTEGKENLCKTTDFDHQLESRPYDDLAGIFPMNYEPAAFTAKDSGKLQVLIDLLASIHEQNSAERVVLVSNYTQTLDILQEMCKRFGYSYTRLDGQTAVSQRQKIVDSFNSKHGQSFIFLLSSKAGGVGLNLIGASRLVLYDIDWNPANDVQAMARVWRDGQKRPVHIYRLLTTGTIEEKIYQRQVSKQSLSGTVVDLKKKSEHASFSLEELRNLFQLEEDSNCLTHDLLYCNCLGNGQPIGAPEEATTPDHSNLTWGYHRGQYRLIHLKVAWKYRKKLISLLKRLRLLEPANLAIIQRRLIPINTFLCQI
ncbi:DNA repair and recombination protein RAD54B-like [Rhincodon typus]|uniref:DNA repair and recombination protein RAD54B-like n=1 Tax=Rhincodon typus TaxID=259920 RepID=UPI00202E8353|nr:DNA repair and recombination protein RAD54B-like [Rhincodon typus]